MELGGAACEGRGKDETGVLRFMIHSHSVGLFRCGPFLLQLCIVMYSPVDDDCDILVRPGKDHYSTLGTNRFRIDLRGLERKSDGMLFLFGNWDFFSSWMELRQIELGQTLDLGTDLLYVVLAGSSLPSISGF